MANPSSEFLDDLEACIRNCDRMKSEIPTSEAVEVAKRRLEHFFSILGMLLESNDDCEMLTELNGNVEEWLNWVGKLPVAISSCCTTPAGISPMRIYTGSPGCPRFLIEKETLEYLSDSGFSWVKIAQIFGVSRSTITQRVSEYGIQSSQSYSDISDEQLRAIISEIHSQYTHAGCRIVRAMLLSRGIKVTFSRVHRLLTTVDPILSSRRWGALIRRRSYHVKAANSLWHIDGHHKPDPLGNCCPWRD